MAIESAAMATSIQQIKSEVLTPLFRGNGSIAFYAEEGPVSPEGVQAYGDYVAGLSAAPVSRLTALLLSLVDALEDADPKKIAEAQGRPGVSPVDVLEVKIKYQVGFQRFDGCYEELQLQVGRVRSMTMLYEPVMGVYTAQVEHIEQHVLAGQEFLAGCAYAEAAVPSRLGQRLQELAAKAAMLRNSVLQMRLSLACSQEVLDQFDGLPEGMVSKWLSHRHTPMAGHQVDPEDLEKAVTSHRLLLDSLAGLCERAENARDQEKAAAIALAHEIIVERELVEDDIFRERGGRWELRRESRVPRYCDPVSGVQWTGKERVPPWLQGEDLGKYLVRD